LGDFSWGSSFPKMMTCMDALMEHKYSEKGTFSARRQDLEFDEKTAHRETLDLSQNNTKMQPELQPTSGTNTKTACMGAELKLELK
jgi:hypothetical protein